MKDKRGNEVVVGSKVAYNRSGEVLTGKILRIITSKRNGYTNTSFEIEPEKAYPKWHSPTTTVKRIESLVVIDEPEPITEPEELIENPCFVCGHSQLEHFEGYAECRGGYGCDSDCGAFTKPDGSIKTLQNSSTW